MRLLVIWNVAQRYDSGEWCFQFLSVYSSKFGMFQFIVCFRMQRYDTGECQVGELGDIFGHAGWFRLLPNFAWWLAYIYPSPYIRRKNRKIYHRKSKFFSFFLHFLYKRLLMSRWPEYNSYDFLRCTETNRKRIILYGRFRGQWHFTFIFDLQSVDFW